jgi:hypothetical protein
MNKQERWRFFVTFSPGIILMVLVYIALTIFRDLRDNFAVELWADLGYGDTPEILLTAEIPIAISVFCIIGLMMFIRNNRTAFYANLAMIAVGGVLLFTTTLLFQYQLISPILWMILVGFAMYLAYISYHTMLFERWIALFRHKSNIGFLMYVADAFGYLGSVAILFYKNFGEQSGNWLSFISSISLFIGGITFVLSLAAIVYFRQKEKQLSPT